MDSKNLVVGVDIGGSHITAGIVDLDGKSVFGETIIRRYVDCHAAADDILEIWTDTIKDVWRKSALPHTKIGFAMPGPFNYGAGICFIKDLAKYESLYGLDIRNALAERLSIEGKNILFRNDAEAFLDGEIFCGGAKGYKNVIGITLGTGLGSAYSHDGITADAELGVMKYGRHIIEESVSTRGLLNKYFQLTGIKLNHAKDVADRYDTEEHARIAFSKFAKDLAWFLHFFISREQPEVLVIGGNIANSWELFMPQVLQELKATGLEKLPEIRPAILGEDAAMIGGACCFLHPACASSS